MHRDLFCRTKEEIVLFTKKKVFTVILCILCLMSSICAFAEPVATESAETTAAEGAAEALEKPEEDVPGYVQYLDELAAEAEANAEEESVDEDAERLEYAYSYIDGYADAIQSDANNKENIKEAVKEVRKQVTPFYSTIWSIIPAIIAIALALITKEVYSSLFIGVVAGGLLYANFNFETALNHIVGGGFVANLSDSYNVGILLFLVLLGALVAMMNKAGGSAAFGRWASKHIKSRVGAQLATIALGVMIFVDDYFNCLTVGSVMRPVCDAKKVSRAKLSYLIDATAAPVCIIAPISSWAAAVAGFAPDGQGISLFIKAIPYNFYAIFTIVMMIVIAFMKFDFGPMKLHEKNAVEKGDLFTTLEERTEKAEDMSANKKGKVIDLILPVVVLIICCIIGMIYSGGFFEGASFADAFSNCDASVGLALGSVVAIVLVAAYFIIFRHGTIKFKDLMECIPEGFKAMVPAILILTFAWTLKSMTDSIGAKVFIAEFVNNNASQFVNFLPAIIFLIAVGLSFSTGTSWGTFGILIPIVLAVFEPGSTMAIIGMSACMAGAVCGDHCSPISDTTIMASAGAQCNHINHVSTQLPYAISVAIISFVMYLIAPFIQSAFVLLPLGIAITIGFLFAMKRITANK